MAMSRATAASDRSPPESSESRSIFFPAGFTDTSMPVVSMLSGSVRVMLPVPPGKSTWNTDWNSRAVSSNADVEREFTQVFATLFPGGEGRLVLTNPADMLTTGIEVEARPPGKKIKRLSLLSGGEKSLTAVAMLVAIFRARPSPFYVMDEVEAALDDVNLGRLITLFEQLRERSQLLIITHQKRTMEVADALYGVTMRSGVTQVISQRLKHESED